MTGGGFLARLRGRTHECESLTGLVTSLRAGMVISYALAADHPDRVDHLAVAETNLPGIGNQNLFQDAATNNVLWHVLFNRIETLNEQLVRGREDVFFEYELAHRTVRPLPAHAIRYYVDHYASSRDALRGSFELYRALDATAAQNKQRFDPAPDDAGPGRRRHAQCRRQGRGHDEGCRGQRADPGHPRLRPLRRRGGARSTAGDPDPVPDLVTSPCTRPPDSPRARPQARRSVHRPMRSGTGRTRLWAPMN
ncbi:MAG TPA: hypothetical protein VLJ59_16935 [Mycobacteriales bacterium]|nr:hypothetical protein [Mycobacteriales bacterium]